MNKHKGLPSILAMVFFTLPLLALGQEDDPFALEGVEAETEEQPVIENEVTVGLYYLDDPSYRFGKYTGLTDDGIEALLDFRIEHRPQYDSGDTLRWKVQGWRLGLDSRRLLLDIDQQGTQSFTADYREIPNNRIDDGHTPYRGVGSTNLTLAEGWQVAPGSNNTTGFLTLNESLANLKVDTLRRRLDLSYDRALGRGWGISLDYRHETKKGERTIGSIFGFTGGNPRSVILPAPVDYTTDNLEAMFNWSTGRAQLGFGVFASWFSNDETELVWQNAFGRQPQWAPSVSFPDAQGRLALEPDNSYVQFKAYGGFNFSATTRLTADLAFGEMEQDDPLQPFTINPNLIVHTPVPLQSLDGEIDTTMVNLRLTSQLLRRLALAINYRIDDRDNKTPREVYPYIGADSQDQRPFEDGRINLPYSYEEKSLDATLTYRLNGLARLKGGVDSTDYSRDFSEVANSDEFGWNVGVNLSVFETAAFSIDYRDSDRDVDAYIGNTPLIESHLPGTIAPDEFENHPLLRKYFLTDRERQEIRFRGDFFPVPELNLGIAANHFEDDYDAGFFGLNQAEIKAYTADFGWYPREQISLTGYYTREMYDSEQSSRSFNNAAAAANPANNWFADSSDDVDTWNLALAFTDLGAERGWKGFDAGFDYTYSNTESQITVTAVTAATAPLPELRSELRSISAWAAIDIASRSSLRFSIENQRLETDDFALDGVAPDTLANVLTLGESAANYDVILLSGSWTFRF